MMVGVLGLFPACNKPPSVETVNHIAVATSTEIWEALEQEITAALEPRTFTVRDEQILDIAYVHPADVASSSLRRMRQVLLIGSARAPLIAEALAGRNWQELTPPVVIQLSEVWARQQRVTVALLPEAAGPGVVEPLLPRIRDLFLQQFDEQIRMRMAVTAPSELLPERLREVAGFTLVVPRNYQYEQAGSNLFVFRNEEPGSTPLIRTITVDSRAREAVDWTAEEVAAWRAGLAERVNDPPHVTETLPESLQGEIGDQLTIQIQGVWSNPPGEWPSAGPFVSRIVECPERVFLIDAWLYAPGQEKYEYMSQFDIILDTFQCPTEGASASGSGSVL